MHSLISNFLTFGFLCCQLDLKSSHNLYYITEMLWDCLQSGQWVCAQQDSWPVGTLGQAAMFGSSNWLFGAGYS